MADIMLAECGGGTWLVAGEEYIDDLLAGTLPEGVTIEFVAVSGRAELHDMWVRHCGEPAYGGNPWMIHPGIVRRIRGTPPSQTVNFPPWSVMPDEAGLQVLRDASAWAQADPGRGLTLATYADTSQTGPAADLSALRLQILETELSRHLDQRLLSRECREMAASPVLAPGEGRIDIIRIDKQLP